MSEEQSGKRARSPGGTEAEQPVEKKAHVEQAQVQVQAQGIDMDAEEAASNGLDVKPSGAAPAAATSSTPFTAADHGMNEEDALNGAAGASSSSTPAQSAQPSTGTGDSNNISNPNEHKVRGQLKQEKQAAHREKYKHKHDHFAGRDRDRDGNGRGQGGRRGGEGKFSGGRNAEDAQRAAGEGEGEGEGEGAEGREGEGEGAGEGEGKKRLSKKKCALIIGFCGTGYQGMQIQPDQTDVKTIEGDVFEALIKAGAVSAENAESHKKVDVQRSARTDAGVHAAGNVISLKMIYDPPLPEGVASLKDHVNSFLPEQIRMWGFVRTMKSFQARTVYEYLLPSYCLLPPASSDAICTLLNGSSPGWRDGLGPGAEFADQTPDMTGSAGEGEALNPKERGEFERRRGWRIDQGTLERFRELVNEFHGSHNFHNYTVGKPFNDRTVKRYMIKLEVREPVIHGDIEWISVRIHGQSFMLHQIRKMMSLAMLACRTGTPKSLIAETFGPKKIHIPKAPPLGLLLQRPVFKTYNDRLKHVGGGGGPKKGANAQEGEEGEGTEREPLDLAVYEDEMEAFKLKWIYEKLRQEELENNVFHKWIRQVDCTASTAFSFLNSKGTIPPEAAHGFRQRSRQDKAKGGEAGKEGQDVKTEEGESKIDESDDEDVDMAALKRGELEG